MPIDGREMFKQDTKTYRHLYTKREKVWREAWNIENVVEHKTKNDRKPEKVKREKWIGGEPVSSVMVTRWGCGRFRRRFRPRLQTLKGVERCGRRTIARPVNLSCWGWSSLVLLLWRGTRWRCCRHCRRIQSLCHGFRLNRQHQSIGRLALSFPFFGRLTSVIEIPTFTFCFLFPEMANQ